MAMTFASNRPKFSSDDARPPSEQALAEQDEERRKLSRLQRMIDMVISILRQDPNLKLEEANQIVANCKIAALSMFPDKELAFDLIYRPRLQRVLAERFPLQ
jgi:hypothetical protein